MRRFLSILIAAAAAMLTACATAYSPALDGRPVARIRFVTEHPGSTSGIEATWVAFHPNHCAPAVGKAIDAPNSNLIAILTGNVSLGTPILAAAQPKGAMKRLGILGEVPPKDSLFSERLIPAGQQFGFSMRSNQRTGGGFNYIEYTACSVGVEFVPMLGMDYEAVFGRGSRNTCAIHLYRVSSDVGARTPEPITKLPLCGWERVQSHADAPDAFR